MDETSPEPITPTEQDLASIAAHLPVDGFLTELALTADSGLGVPVGLLVNGMIVLGTLAKPEAIAEDIDAQLRTVAALIEKPEEMAEDEWAAAMERLATKASRSIRLYREQVERLDEKIKALGTDGVDLETAPAGMSREVIFVDARPNVTLTNASIYAPGQRGATRVPVLRVSAAHVTGWWIGRVDAEGSVRTELWSDDDPAAS